jgi:DNA invertase Pin-like site-specific DNA recombinase
MIIGYARTSTADQIAGLEAQLRDLQNAGCEKIFHEQTTGTTRARPQLEGALAYAIAGDTLVVTALTRLGRSVVDLLQIKEELETKGVNLKILELGIDTGTPIGRMLFTMIGAISQFERELMLERQREGIAKARRDGKYKGRRPAARLQTPEIMRLKNEERLSAAKIAERLGISTRSVEGVWAANRPEGYRSNYQHRNGA